MIFDSVFIPAGNTSANFSFDALDDGLADGSQRVTISAQFTNGTTASALTLVHDVQSASLTLGDWETVSRLVADSPALLESSGALHLSAKRRDGERRRPSPKTSPHEVHDAMPAPAE